MLNPPPLCPPNAFDPRPEWSFSPPDEFRDMLRLLRFDEPKFPKEVAPLRLVFTDAKPLPTGALTALFNPELNPLLAPIFCSPTNPFNRAASPVLLLAFPRIPPRLELLEFPP